MLIAPTGQLVHQRFRDIFDDRKSPRHVAIQSAITRGHFAFVARGQHNGTVFVGHGHEQSAAYAGLYVFFGGVYGLALEIRRQRLQKFIEHGHDGQLVVADLHSLSHVARVNQGNAATVQISLLQAKDVSGTGSKAINAVPIWLQNATATSDLNVAQSNGASFTTDATIADKIVMFEITPEVTLDMANGYKCLAVQTGASNVANVTEATLYVYGSYQQAVPISTYIN